MAYLGSRNPWTDRHKIFSGAIQAVVTLVNFCEDRLRGFGVACECVIIDLMLLAKEQFQPSQ